MQGEVEMEQINEESEMVRKNMNRLTFAISVLGAAMSVAMGDDMESEYKVIFRSYTGALVYFYVDKASGKTRIVEHVPTLNIENEVGTINLFDYLEKPAE